MQIIKQKNILHQVPCLTDMSAKHLTPGGGDWHRHQECKSLRQYKNGLKIERELCLKRFNSQFISSCYIMHLSVANCTIGILRNSSEVKNLIGRVRKCNRAARAVRTYEKVRAVLCKTTAYYYHIYS